MTTNPLAELEPDAPTAKRAQYEAFEFVLEAPGELRVTNGSYGDDEKADQFNIGRTCQKERPWGEAIYYSHW